MKKEKHDCVILMIPSPGLPSAECTIFKIMLFTLQGVDRIVNYCFGTNE